MPHKSEYTPLPSHKWLFFNKLRDWLAWVLIIALFIMFTSAYAITYMIRRDCTDVYNRRFNISGYWVTIGVGSNKEGCPDAKP